MNNLSSYCGLVDAKIRASDKDLPVLTFCHQKGNKGKSFFCTQAFRKAWLLNYSSQFFVLVSNNSKDLSFKQRYNCAIYKSA